MREFAAALPKLRRAVRRGIELEGMPRERALATAVRIRMTRIRPGVVLLTILDSIFVRVEAAVRNGLLDYEESGRLLKFYEDGLNGYTYLEDRHGR